MHYNDVHHTQLQHQQIEGQVTHCWMCVPTLQTRWSHKQHEGISWPLGLAKFPQFLWKRWGNLWSLLMWSCVRAKTFDKNSKCTTFILCIRSQGRAGWGTVFLSLPDCEKIYIYKLIIIIIITILMGAFISIFPNQFKVLQCWRLRSLLPMGST